MDPTGLSRPPNNPDRSPPPMVRVRNTTPGSPTGIVYRVLLIEDNKWDAELTQQLLREAGNTGFAMEWAQRLQQGLSRVAAGDVDLVLLDLSLPDSRGLGTVAKLRAEAPQVPLIVLTGLEDESAGTEAIKLGAEDYLVKGRFDGNLLVRAMKYALERSRFQQERRAALEWKKELDHLREVDRLRTLFMGASTKTIEPADPMDAVPELPQAPENAAALVDQLLELAQIQDGTASLALEDVDLNKIAQELVETVQPLAETQRLSVETFAQGPLMVHADPLRVIRVVRVLLNNALRFTKPGGRIMVETETKDHQAILHVRDTGLGIAPQALATLFQGPPRDAQNPEGHRGVSLFLARHFVELQGGRMWAHSDGAGFGSTFSFSLPLSRE